MRGNLCDEQFSRVLSTCSASNLKLWIDVNWIIHSNTIVLHESFERTICLTDVLHEKTTSEPGHRGGLVCRGLVKRSALPVPVDPKRTAVLGAKRGQELSPSVSYAS